MEVTMIVLGIVSQGEPQVVKEGIQQEERLKDDRDLDKGANHQDPILLWIPKESQIETPNPSGVTLPTSF